MKRMTEDQIPAFVRDVADTGCNITAVLGVGYAMLRDLRVALNRKSVLAMVEEKA